MFKFEDDQMTSEAMIKVVGVGGGGGNALTTMIDSGLEGVEFIAANTDLQALQRNPATCKIQLGACLTKGLGAGANPEVGRNAALEDHDRIAEVLGSPEMVFITAGMGGGTGTGAAPVIAEVSRQNNALAVAVVTKPFAFEGRRRQRQAEEGIKELHGVVDTLITIPNNKLLSIAGDEMSMQDAFRKADEVLLNAVRGISDLINVSGLINVDFADVKTIMSNQGLALMGTGTGRGGTRAVDAALSAIHSPLLDDVRIDGAMGILINITGGPSVRLSEINAAAETIAEAAHEDANIIFGSVVDEEIEDEVRITVIATGFEEGRRTSRMNSQQSQGRPSRRLQSAAVANGTGEQAWGGQLDLPPALREPVGAATVSDGDLNTTAHRRSRMEPENRIALDIPTFLRRNPD
ncbi:MAG: cell division protein FtsZ [Myxococcales bacterium]|nr:cell division protein FtsZ [Myxococcales bacterium]